MEQPRYSAEAVYQDQLWASGDPHFDPPVMEELKKEARNRGLWNLFLPHDTGELGTPGHSNLDYAPLARSSAAATSRRRPATARRRTRGTWRS